MSKENILHRLFKAITGIIAEIFLTLVLMAFAFLIGFFILKVIL